METIKGETVMTRVYGRGDDEIRKIHAKCLSAVQAGGTVTDVLKQHEIPVGTFYSNCTRLGLTTHLSGKRPAAKKRAKFIEFAPTESTGMKINFKGLTIECSTPEMLKMAVSTLVGE